MRTGYTQIDEWPVRPYSKRELAMAYAPEISPVSALNRLAEWMSLCSGTCHTYCADGGNR